METALLKAYRQIFAGKGNTPTWAVHKTTPGHTDELVHCPIPFVGRQYAKEKVRLLLYASAENLSDYNSKGKNYLDCDDYAVNRHRNSFDLSVTNPDVFFPDVHIQPISDGCLAIAALYVYMRFQAVDRISPADFLEHIAFANYCKYSIQPGLAREEGRNRKQARNQDHAGNADYLKESHDYIKQDFEILQPDIIIIPKTIYYTDRRFVDQLKGGSRIIPIYQINARNINLRIKHYPRTEEKDLNEVLHEWYKNLGKHGIRNKTKENFLSIFNYIDDVLQHQAG